MGILVRNNKVISAGGKILYRNVSPFDLPNLKLYLSATRMAQQADESSVSSFTDFSGNSFHATQANTSLQPLFKTNQFGSNAGIKFDGVDNVIQITTSNALDIFRNINQWTVQILAKRGSINSPCLPFYVLNSTNISVRVTFGWRNDQFAQIIIKNYAETTNQTFTWVSNDTNPHFIQFTLNPSNNTVYVYEDGILVGTIIIEAGYMPNTASGRFDIGAYTGNGPVYATGSVNGISVNTSYSDPSTIQAQYRGYLQRGYL
jgi:hypothetical protein